MVGEKNTCVCTIDTHTYVLGFIKTLVDVKIDITYVFNNFLYNANLTNGKLNFIIKQMSLQNITQI